MKFIVKKDVSTSQNVITEAIFEKGDESLETLVFPSEIRGKKISAVDLYNLDAKHPIKLKFEEGISKVGNFSMNKHITEVYFPKSLEFIVDKAFYCCSLLKKITFEEGSHLIAIGEDAFGYTAIDSVEIPASVVSIGAVAFTNTALRRVTFEDNSNLRSIEIGAFAYNPRLEYAEFPDSKYMIKAGTDIFRDSISLVSFKFKGNNLNKIPSKMFFNSKIASITNIPEKVKAIHSSAFMYCNHLETINLAHTQLKKIHKQAFYKSGLSSITLPNTLLEIGDSAFEATTLTEIALPNNVKTIGRKAFYNAELKEIKNIEVLTMASVGDSCFGFNKFKTLSLPPLVNAGNKIFSNNNYLESVEVCSGSVELPFEMFMRCEKLNAVSLPDSIKKIWARAFVGCFSLEEIDLSHVEYIGSEAFLGTLLTKFQNYSPSLIIGDSAFKDCEINEIKTSPYAQIAPTAFTSLYGEGYVRTKIF